MSQEGDFTYTDNGVSATITAYTGYGGEISIPSTLGGYPVVALANNAFYSNEGQLITKILSMPSTLTTMGYRAFYYCNQMTSVSIGSGVTTFGNYLFGNCTALTSVTVPGSVTNMGTNAFDYCTALTTVVIQSGVSSIGGGAFTTCINLTSISIPNTVTEIKSQAFNTCSSLANITIPSSVTVIQMMAFVNCDALTSIIIPANVTDIGGEVFSDCSTLTSITFLGLVAPTVGTDWIYLTPSEIRGHAYAASNFPTPGNTFYGLTMGDQLPSPLPPRSFGVILGGF
jgi:hypothetical protein